MDFLLETLGDAFGLMVNADGRVFSAVAVSLQVSLTATVLACCAGIPAAYFLWSHTFRGHGALLTVINALLGTPTIVVGLFLYVTLCRRGPAGDLDLLFSQTAMVLGQAVLGLPIVVALAYAALKSLDPRARETAVTLGAGRGRLAWTLLYEARFAVAAAVITAFGRLVGEVGISMMLGGNIAHNTRNMSTAIALETSKGEFAFGIALGIILLSTALAVNVLLGLLQGRRHRTEHA